MQNNTYGIYNILGLLFALFIVMLTVVYIVTKVWLPFKRERNFIKIKIECSDGAEKEYWQKNLKKLYINSIPVYRTVYRKYLNR